MSDEAPKPLSFYLAEAQRLRHALFSIDFNQAHKEPAPHVAAIVNYLMATGYPQDAQNVLCAGGSFDRGTGTYFAGDWETLATYKTPVPRAFAAKIRASVAEAPPSPKDSTKDTSQGAMK